MIKFCGDRKINTNFAPEDDMSMFIALLNIWKVSYTNPGDTFEGVT